MVRRPPPHARSCTHSSDTLSFGLQELRLALKNAREAGVSDGEISSAETTYKAVKNAKEQAAAKDAKDAASKEAAAARVQDLTQKIRAAPAAAAKAAETAAAKAAKAASKIEAAKVAATEKIEAAKEAIECLVDAENEADECLGREPTGPGGKKSKPIAIEELVLGALFGPPKNKKK